ncbi:alpha/beta fold hydrolase [Streptosporangium sp. NPDC049376]|uniref:alpha/beta fold hydrolase n=1 Tax=Streptosporangium sp. NPDC049376 TaxID=3366192 RepID=UPI0037912A94
MSGRAEIEWHDDVVTSADGTTIAFLSQGNGPGLVVIPGNNRRAHHYGVLARELSDTYAVHVIERRGRGLSGPQGPGYGVETEVDDAVAVMERTGSDLVFGHSYGGLTALHLGLRRRVAALMAFMMLSGAEGRDMRAMMATTPAEIGEIGRLDSDGTRYAGIASPALLLGGEKTPGYLTGVLPRLAEVMPDARYVISRGLDHNAPDLNAPQAVAGQIRAFLRERLVTP